MVFGEHYPAIGAGIRQPHLVKCVLRIALVKANGIHAGIAHALGQGTAKTAIDQERQAAWRILLSNQSASLTCSRLSLKSSARDSRSSPAVHLLATASVGMPVSS